MQAVAAFSAFFRQYHSSGQGEVARQYMQGLRSETPAIRRGSASALGALPGHLLRPCACEVLLSLAAATKVRKRRLVLATVDYGQPCITSFKVHLLLEHNRIMMTLLRLHVGVL